MTPLVAFPLSFPLRGSLPFPARGKAPGRGALRGDSEASNRAHRGQFQHYARGNFPVRINNDRTKSLIELSLGLYSGERQWNLQSFQCEIEAHGRQGY
jgi:hypothetical protein